MIPTKCGRCGKDIITLEDYGGYSVQRNIELCRVCWEQWIKMRNTHHKAWKQWIEIYRVCEEEFLHGKES